MTNLVLANPRIQNVFRRGVAISTVNKLIEHSWRTDVPSTVKWQTSETWKLLLYLSLTHNSYLKNYSWNRFIGGGLIEDL